MKVFGHELKQLKDRPDTNLDVQQKETYVTTHTILNVRFKTEKGKPCLRKQSQ